MTGLSVVILAAGAGTRMKSSLPKPLHAVAGRPMLAHVIDIARQLNPRDIVVVASQSILSRTLSEEWSAGVLLAEQHPPRGTGDAVRVALSAGVVGDTVLVLYADHPLVTPAVLVPLVDQVTLERKHLAVLTCIVEDAAGYGRIQRDEAGRLQSIVEKVDDETSLRARTTEINSGVMALDRAWAVGALADLAPNPRKNEYFLTDLVEIAYREDPNSTGSAFGSTDILVGVNDRAELAVADHLLMERKRAELIESGVTLIAPATNVIDLDVVIEADTTVGPHCVIESGTRIGAGCRIGPHAVIRNSVVGERVRIESSTIEDTSIGADADVGPYSHLRGGTEIGPRVHIGNFAELKNARVAEDVRIGHFSYVGDASLGANVNIGAGVVTCNFDGVAKHRTEIGADAFIGSDSMLIAPLTIGDGARTGAGAVVTKDVAPGATVVGMPARQIKRKPLASTGEDEG